VKALLIHQAFVSPGQAGGTRHYEFAQHLRKRGHALHIVASDLDYLTGRRTTGASGLLSREEIEGVTVFRAYTYPSLHRSFRWRVVSFLSFMVTSVFGGLRTGPIDLVIGTSPPIFQALSAWLVALLRRRPFLLEIRDLWPDFAVGLGVLRNKFLIWSAKRLENFLYARSAHILVNSPAYRDYLVKKGISLSKITLIPNGADPEMFKPDEKGCNVRRDFSLNGSFVVTYAGALGLANDIPTLLRAAGLLKKESRIKFLIVGDGKEAPRLKQMAQASQLSNVVFTNARPKSEMKNFLAASDACVAILQNIPLFTTTYPNKVFDYMAAARPVILAVDGVIRQEVESARAGIFVPPGDASALAQAILHLANNPLLGAELGANGRKHVLANFNRAQQAKAFESLLQRLARAGHDV
jgi:glycosyltransferase involved in cell wall biosynthesis